VRDCQRDRDGTPKQSEIHHQHSIPVDAVIFIFGLGTHTQKVMAMMMMGREYTTRRRASRLIVFHQKKEEEEEEEEDES
jgi:hypothetical protein